MPALVTIPFYLAVAAYTGAAVQALRFVREPDDRLLFQAKRVAAGGNVLLLAVFVYRWVQFGLVPLTNLGDILILFLVLSTGIILLIQRQERMRPLLCYYLPSLALLALISGALGPRHLQEPPKDLNGLLLTVHVGLVFLSFALFFVASLTAFAYIGKARSLKQHKPGGFAQRLPSLERLDHTLYRLIAAGYPAFVATLALGFGWAFAERETLGQYWFVSPKILFSVVMVVFYAISFHTRRFGLLRGPKLAYLVFYGFASLLAVYLVMAALQLTASDFWRAGP